MDNNNSSNKVIVALLSVLVAAVVCIGGYFIIRDINGNHGDDKSSTSQGSGNNDKGSSSQSQSGSSSSSSSSSDTSGSSTPTPQPVENEIAAGITYAEVRGNDYYIEVQADGQINGTCDIVMVPTNGGQGPHGTDDLEISNKVSICNEEFSLKGMNPGEHKITVTIKAVDGRTKVIEKIVNF